MEDQIKKLDSIIDADLNNFENLGLNDEAKAKNSGIILKEMQVNAALKKQIGDQEDRKVRLELEKAAQEQHKQEHQDDYNVQLKNIDIRLKEIEQNQAYHNAELNIQLQKLENEKHYQTWSLVFTGAGLVVTLVLGIVGRVMYYKLASNAQAHEYNDYQLEPSSSKENRNNILKEN